MNAPGLVQQLVLDAESVKYGRIVAHVIDLHLRAKELQRASRSLIVLDTGVGAERPENVAAVFGETDHPFLVQPIGSGSSARTMQPRGKSQ